MDVYNMPAEKFDEITLVSEKAAYLAAKNSDDAFVAALNRQIARGREHVTFGTVVAVKGPR